MTKYKKQIIAVASSVALFANIAGAAYGTTTIQITGNGTQSDNTVNYTQANTTTVVQANDAKIDNNVDVNAKTGNNSADGNTTGDVVVKSGDADVNVDIKNKANANILDVENCNCGADADVLISGNGSDTTNTVNLANVNATTVAQTNTADIKNDVDVDAKTGGNSADDNTGGNVEVKSGNASVGVTLSTSANLNSASIHGGSNGGGSVSARILGNGTGSDNTIGLGFTNVVLLQQVNDAVIDNDVDVDAETGHNDADDNTGGNVKVKSGDADVTVEVDNLANFNAADIDCGCVLDVLAKVADNGSDTTNDLTLGLADSLNAFQDNVADLDNDLKDLNAKTGYNGADDNTGEADSENDPEVKSGDAGSEVKVENDVNTNTYGDAGFDLPDMGDVEFDFDLSFLMGWLSMHS